MANQVPTINDFLVILKKKGDFFDKNNISENVLPRNIDVLSYLYFLKAQSEYHIKLDQHYSTICKKIIHIWDKTGLSTVTYRYVKIKLIELVNKYAAVKRKTHKENCHSNDLFFLNQLFNVGKCKCLAKIKSKADAINFCCKCAYKNNLSERQYEFFRDQIHERLLNIEIWFGEEDAIVKDLSNLSMSPPPQSSLTPLPQSTTLPNVSNQNVTSKTSVGNNTDTDNSDKECDNHDKNKDPDYSPEAEKIIPRSIDLPRSIGDLDFNPICAESARFNSSFREVSAIVNRTLEMIGAINSKEKGLVVTPALLQNKHRLFASGVAENSAKENENKKICCFFFDGLSAKNVMRINSNGTSKIDKSTQYENIIMVEQPNDNYLGFVTTAESDAETIFKEMKQFFLSQKIELTELIAIGSDGAATNVGASNGIIRQFEQYLNLPLHRIICLLHLLELILKAIISLYYGTTKAPNKYTKQINQQLEECEKSDIVQFEPISLENMPPVNYGNSETFQTLKVTNDQKLLLDLSEAISNGSVCMNLAQRTLGELSSIRWTNYASRFLRLYMSTDCPPYKLISIVRFIQKVYVPILFSIKCQPEWIYGPRHIFNILLYSQGLSVDMFKVVKDRIIYNSYFLHSENLLLSMIVDGDRKIRRKAYDIILCLRMRQSRNERSEDLGVRIFSKPAAIQFEHQNENAVSCTRNPDHYSKLYNWNDIDSIYEPPFTKKMSLAELKHYMESEDIIEVPNIPSHAQATEHNVQIVKSVVTKYVGHKTQDQRVRAKILARDKNQQFKLHYRKSDYEVFQQRD